MRAERDPRVRSLAAASLRVAVVALVLLTGCGFADDDRPVIRFYEGEWPSLSVINAIARFIVEQGYGYDTEAVVVTAFELEDALPSGEIDVNLEGWQQNFPVWYREQISAGTIANLGPTFEESAQFFVIPAWVGEQYGIRTIADMKEHWKLFQDPQDPSKGVFYNCDMTSKCAEINRVKLEAYGLDRYYNAVTPSLQVLEATLASAQERHQPVFGYHWTPTALMGRYDWRILEEPPFSEECWQAIADAISDGGPAPASACAYETRPIDTLISTRLLKKAPGVVQMLRSMDVGTGALNETLAWMVDEQVGSDWERAAIHYLLKHRERWRGWVTDEAHARIEEALKQS